MFETACDLAGQLRMIAGMGGGGAVGLDMGAALALGEARGCDMELLAGVLPQAEQALLARQAGDDEDRRFGRDEDEGDAA